MREQGREIMKRMAISSSISAFAGLLVNLLIDLVANMDGYEGFISISADFVAGFPTPVMAAYVNVLLYGVIGAAFAGMTFVFFFERMGFVVQFLLYFVLTSPVLAAVTILLWKLHRYPQALIPTFAGYALTYVIMGIVQYRELKKDIREINEALRE